VNEVGLLNRNVPLATPDFQWWNPTRIIFGDGKVEDLPNELDLDPLFENKKRAFILTDEGVKNAGLLDYLLDALKSGGREVIGIFDSVMLEADRDQIYEIAALAAEAEPDYWIALGGGSVIDAAKAVSLLHSNGGELENYEGMYLVEQECMPLICIPTTAGTGSEVTWGAVVLDRRNKKKLILGDYKFIPKIAVLDPQVTKTLPRHLVVATALDALTHAIGSMASDGRQDLSGAIALRAIEMIADNLEEAYHHNAKSFDVRAKMLIASNMAGIAFQTAIPGADHGIGHTVGALHNIHHGLAVAIANLYVMEYNMSAVPHVYAAVARALGVDKRGIKDEVLGMMGIEKLIELYQKVDVKLTYRDYGYPTDPEAVEQLIEQSMDDSCMIFNPVGISRTAAYEALIKKCIGV